MFASIFIYCVHHLTKSSSTKNLYIGVVVTKFIVIISSIKIHFITISIV